MTRPKGTLKAFLDIKNRKRKLPADDTGKAQVDEWHHEPTDVKLAILASFYPNISHDALLDVLLAHDGSVSGASKILKATQMVRKAPSALGVAHQRSLRSFIVPANKHLHGCAKKSRLLSRKGTTLHLFDPADIEQHTPCSVMHGFLPADLANDLLRELVDEAASFEKITFKLFDNVVSSPHTSCLFVDNLEEVKRQKREYVYNGSTLTVSISAPSIVDNVGMWNIHLFTHTHPQDIRHLTPHLTTVKPLVQAAVNEEIQRRMTHYHGGERLRHQSPEPWAPNVAVVNCYCGPKQNLGWHSDQLTYLGPRAVIGSLSLGVAREFRVRKIIPHDDNSDDNDHGHHYYHGGGDESGGGGARKKTNYNPDEEGQISIHLPHNSLLVMHAEMQEEWKHAVVPAQAIDSHPVSGSKRINVTYRWYRESLHPRLTPRCACGVPTVLRVVQRKRENRGRYFWMCHAGNIPGKKRCSFFKWAKFDDDGDPMWDGTESEKTVDDEKP